MPTPTFFENPILNSPYEYPKKHWETDGGNQPTGRIVSSRRPSSLRSPIPAPKSKREDGDQPALDLFSKEIDGVDYQENSFINMVRAYVDEWRALPREKWGVTPETARLLEHWRHYDFPSYRPFFCQVEAVETLVWLTEVAPKDKRKYGRVLDELVRVNQAADPDLFRIACKLATGAGKTTVMAMVIAWQTINAAHHGVSDKFTNGFLVCTPGITIKDRLQILLPNDTESYYKSRQLVPVDYLPLLGQARIVITNYHAFMPRSVLEVSAGTRRMLVGPSGDGPQTVETEGQMLRRVMPELLGLKSVLVINDEAHHCYRHRPEDADAERALDADEKAEAKENEEAARVWISGLEALRRLIPSTRVLDLSATPFFLRGSGYEEGTLFPWTVSDFSLMDALECGIVKLPRIPISDDMKNPDAELPVYRDLWKHIRDKMPKKGRGKGGDMNPANLPNTLITAIRLLYENYERAFRAWAEAGYRTPPCFIFVCQNTTISKLVYDYVSGYVVKDADGNEETRPAACPLFSNFDADGNPLAMPNTLLVDSLQLESGEALSADFRAVADKEIETYKRDLVNRTGDRAAAEKLSDSDLLREVMNTVGKEGRLGGQIRCVVSVSMLTEGWDANTVTHILGVRAFGTQLLCEQVVGRALRRLDYTADPATGLYKPEYADIFGIPFDFASKGVKGPPPPPPDVVRVRAVHPERDDLAILFPRVSGYYLDQRAPDREIRAAFTETSALTIGKEHIGPSKTLVAGFVGSPELYELKKPSMRPSEVVARLAGRFVERYYDSGYTVLDRTRLFGKIKRLFTEWVDGGYLRGLGKDLPELAVQYRDLLELACEKMNDAIVKDAVARNPETFVSAQLDDFLPTGSTDPVNFVISRTAKILHETAPDKCPVNYAVCDSDWERMVCEILEAHPATIAYARNYNLGFQVPYVMSGERRSYEPDFIVLVDDGRGRDDPLHLVIEVKGYRYLDADVKKATMLDRWIPGVNKLESYGRWAFVELDQNDFGFGSFSDPAAVQAAAAIAYDNIVKDLSK